MRNGSAIANGVRQYAVSVDNAAWYQLESSSGAVVPASGLAASMPVLRWRGQAGTSTTGNQNQYDYVQGLLIQNTSATLTLFVTTTDDQSGGAPTSRATANALQVGPGRTLRLDNTDATKVYLRASAAGPIIAAVLCT